MSTTVNHHNVRKPEVTVIEPPRPQMIFDGCCMGCIEDFLGVVCDVVCSCANSGATLQQSRPDTQRPNREFYFDAKATELLSCFNGCFRFVVAMNTYGVNGQHWLAYPQLFRRPVYEF